LPADFRDEVSSWDSMKDALRLEDRIRMRDLFDRASRNASAMQSIKEDFQTEAFILLLLLEQYKTIKKLESELALLKEEEQDHR
jgi:hypothetical protein